MESGAVTRVVDKNKGIDKGKSVTWAVSVSEEDSVSSTKAAPFSRWKKGIAVTDFVLRLGVIGAAMSSSVTMGNNEDQLPFFTQFLQFHAVWSNFPVLVFFVIANGVVTGCVMLSLPFSYVCIVQPHAVRPRLLLMTVDTVMMGLVCVAAAGGAAIMYVGHNGSQEANWMAFCQSYTNFCQAGSEAVIFSFVAATFFLCLVPLSALALKRN